LFLKLTNCASVGEKKTLIRTGTYFAKPIITDYITSATTEGEKI
jgi:hypothetical protein